MFLHLCAVGNQRSWVEKSQMFAQGLLATHAQKAMETDHRRRVTVGRMTHQKLRLSEGVYNPVTLSCG